MEEKCECKKISCDRCKNGEANMYHRFIFESAAHDDDWQLYLCDPCFREFVNALNNSTGEDIHFSKLN